MRQTSASRASENIFRAHLDGLAVSLDSDLLRTRISYFCMVFPFLLLDRMCTLYSSCCPKSTDVLRLYITDYQVIQVGY